MKILLIAPDDGNYVWIKDLLIHGECVHEVTCVHTEREASNVFYKMTSDSLLYDLVILCESWVPMMTIDELSLLSEGEVESVGDAKQSGVRLCQLAQRLGIKINVTSTLIGSGEEHFRTQVEMENVLYISSRKFRKVIRDLCGFKGNLFSPEET